MLKPQDLTEADTDAVSYTHLYGMEGIHHQSDVTFVINTQDMTLINSDMPYCSHSFNQFVVNDGSHVYFLDHGDSCYRGLILSSFSAYSGGYIAQDRACLLYTSFFPSYPAPPVDLFLLSI